MTHPSRWTLNKLEIKKLHYCIYFLLYLEEFRISLHSTLWIYRTSSKFSLRFAYLQSFLTKFSSSDHGGSKEKQL